MVRPRPGTEAASKLLRTISVRLPGTPPVPPALGKLLCFLSLALRVNNGGVLRRLPLSLGSLTQPDA